MQKGIHSENAALGSKSLREKNFFENPLRGFRADAHERAAQLSQKHFC